MKSLWKKDGSGLYVDIFQNVRKDTVTSLNFLEQFSCLLGIQGSQKNNLISEQFRLKGDGDVEKGNWYRAMRNYNQSLSYAENGFRNISMAFANRSLCFLKMNMHEKCIADIELALKANYPKELRAKLEKRRIRCLEQMITATPIDTFEPKLDFESDSNHPGIANVLQMKYDVKFGRYFVAKCDIGVGKTVLIEESFGPAQLMEAGECIVCNTCYKNTMNFIACDKCPKALFCNEECAQNNAYHKMLCGETAPVTQIQYDLTSVLFAIDIFPNAKSLMESVESVVNVKCRMIDIPTSTADKQSKYRMFLKSYVWSSPTKRNLIFSRAQKVYEKLMNQPKIKSTFTTLKETRFLMHLCLMHVLIVLCNPFNTNSLSGFYLFQCHFNHSCAPNILHYQFGNKNVDITSRPIKQGDQLFITYGEQYWTATNATRQNSLQTDFGFHCECEKCTHINWPISSQRIKLDLDYQYIQAVHTGPPIDYSDISKYMILKQKLFAVLKHFGDSSWSTELDMVCQMLENVLNQSVLFSQMSLY